MKYFLSVNDFLIEKAVEVTDVLSNKLNTISKVSKLASRLKDFLNSDNIPDDFKYQKISYVPNYNNALILIDTNGKKTPIRISKLLKMLKLNVSEYEIEDFILVLKDADISDLIVVDGEKIKYYYYKYNCDSTFYSCMSETDKTEYLDIYTNNPEKVKLLVLLNDNKKLIGRCLIWKLDSGQYAMDRIYLNNKKDISKFYRYADKHNILYTVPSKSLVTLKKADYKYYPYLDKLDYYNPNTGILTNIDKKDDGDFIYLKSTNGSYTSGEDVIWSDHLDEYIDMDDSIYDNYLHDFFLEEATESSLINGDSYYKDYMLEIWLANEKYYNEYGYDSKSFVHKIVDKEYYRINKYDNNYEYPVLIGGEYGFGDFDEKNKLFVANQQGYNNINKILNKHSKFFSYKIDNNYIEADKISICIDKNKNIIFNPKTKIVNETYKEYILSHPLLYKNTIIFNTIYIDKQFSLEEFI